jgi:hypothetical protein
MDKPLELKGPFELKLKVHLTDGEREATADYSLPASKFPTEEAIRVALTEAETKAKEQVGPEWRLMNKREFFDVLTHKLTGSNEQFALPGGDGWD